jgi:hypothetical protein
MFIRMGCLCSTCFFLPLRGLFTRQPLDNGNDSEQIEGSMGKYLRGGEDYPARPNSFMAGTKSWFASGLRDNLVST